jgi:hypothetical protein
MTEQIEAFTRIIATAAADLNRQMDAFRDAVAPGWREAVARRGYVGKRCGWYPAKPKRRGRKRS